MRTTQFYCPACFGCVDREDLVCEHCHRVIDASWRKMPYGQRLVRALRHPRPDTRMRAILSLGHRGEPWTAVPLAASALAHPTDPVESRAILASLLRFPEEALDMLAEHPSRLIRMELAAHGHLHGPDHG